MSSQRKNYVQCRICSWNKNDEVNSDVRRKTSGGVMMFLGNREESTWFTTELIGHKECMHMYLLIFYEHLILCSRFHTL